MAGQRGRRSDQAAGGFGGVGGLSTANCGYRSLEKLASTNGRLLIRSLPLAIARCQAVGRPRPTLGLRSDSGGNAPVTRRSLLMDGNSCNLACAAIHQLQIESAMDCNAAHCMSIELLAIQFLPFFGEDEVRSMAFQTCSSKASVSGEFCPGRVA